MMTSGAPAPVPGEFLSYQAMVTKSSVYLSWESCSRQDPYAREEEEGTWFCTLDHLMWGLSAGILETFLLFIKWQFWDNV